MALNLQRPTGTFRIARQRLRANKVTDIGAQNSPRHGGRLHQGGRLRMFKVGGKGTYVWPWLRIQCCLDHNDL